MWGLCWTNTRFLWKPFISFVDTWVMSKVISAVHCIAEQNVYGNTVISTFLQIQQSGPIDWLNTLGRNLCNSNCSWLLVWPTYNVVRWTRIVLYMCTLFNECIKKLSFFHSDFKAESMLLFNSCYLKQIINCPTFCLTLGLRSSDSNVENDWGCISTYRCTKRRQRENACSLDQSLWIGN
jgi:hypothetical protein